MVSRFFLCGCRCVCVCVCVCVCALEAPAEGQAGRRRGDGGLGLPHRLVEVVVGHLRQRDVTILRRVRGRDHSPAGPRT